MSYIKELFDPDTREKLECNKFSVSKSEITSKCPHCDHINKVSYSGGHIKWISTTKGSYKVRACIDIANCDVCLKDFYVLEPDTEMSEELKRLIKDLEKL